jgi:Mn-dependent DtxR family transcriptional regulator
MSCKGRTPDEKFLIKVYEVALAKGDPCLPVDYYSVAKSLGQKETAIKNIVKHLAQANFVKKINDMTLSLTKLGCQFVLNELNEE